VAKTVGMVEKKPPPPLETVHRLGVRLRFKGVRDGLFKGHCITRFPGGYKCRFFLPQVLHLPYLREYIQLRVRYLSLVVSIDSLLVTG